MDSLKSLWKTQLGPKSFGKLNKMEIAFSKKLSIIFPSYVFNHFLNLETLLITNCDALEVIFGNQELNTWGIHEGATAIKLRNLTLKHLPILNHVFPLYLAKQLLQLQVVDIKDCGVQNIVTKHEMAEAVPGLVFPRLASLTLWHLAKLGSFYSGIHTLDCPMLTKLDVYHCSELQVFSSDSQNLLVRMDEQPLFSFQKVHINIPSLLVFHINVNMIPSNNIVI